MNRPDDLLRSVLRGLLLCGLGLAVTSVSALAQPTPPSLDPSQAVTQYIHKVWQRADGLPQNTVMALAQTPDGYLWIATQDGLVRFDGVRFTVFEKTTTPALRTNDINALYADLRGQLWIGTAGGGLVQLSAGRFTRFGAEHGLPNEVVSAIHEDSSGTLWVGTEGGGLSRFADGRFATYTAKEGLPSDHVTSIGEDADGALWVGTRAGASRYQGGRFFTYNSGNGLPSDDVRAVYTSRDDSVWIATLGGLSRFRDGRFTTYTEQDGLSSSLIRTVFEDRAGTLWIGTVGGGLSRIVQGRISSFDARDRLSDNDVRAVFEDAEGSLWVGTNTGGLNRFTNSKVVTYGIPEGLSHDITLGMATDREGTLWVATYGGGINRLRNGRWSAYSTSDGLASNIVLSVAPAHDGGMWIGTVAGVDRFREDRFQHYGPEVGLSDEPVLALLEDRRGGLWVGTRTGLRHRFERRTTAYTASGGLGSDIVIALLEDRDGRLWVGTEGGGLSVFEKGVFRTYAQTEGLQAATIFSISEDQDGSLWLATKGSGVVRFRNGRFSAYSTGAGLPDDTVFRILEDSGGHLWMSGSRGLFQVRKRDFDAFDAGTLQQIPAVSYGEADGMRSSEANGGIQPAGWRTADGRLWFPTIKGVVAVDPKQLTLTRPPPPVIVEDVLLDREVRDPRAPVVGRPGVRSLEFRYTSPSFIGAANIQFKYLLEGYDPDWVEAGTRRVAYYTNIPPGEYRFRVIATAGADAWNEAGTPVALRLAPHFYQTRTFYALCLAGLMVIAGGLHRARVSGLKAREHDLVRLAEERRRALEALGESEAKFRALFENVLEGVYRSTPEGQILLANRACVRLLGYDAAEALREVNLRSLHAEPDDWARLTLALAETGEVRNIEVALRRRGGEEVTVLESVRAVRGEDGAIVSFEGTLFDISQRKELEERIRQLQKMEIVGRLAGGIAHDFNNLLTPILGYSQLVIEELDAADPIRADVEEIRKAAESAGSLTRQLLMFSRRQVLEPRVLPVNNLIQQVGNILRRLIGEHITLVLRLAPEDPCVKADPGQIEQVLLNLAVNARDAMPAGGTLTIETSQVSLGMKTACGTGEAPGPCVMLAVHDTGAGMTPDVQAHLFEAFFTTKRHGTGLGLSTVHEIVTQAGGHIEVESEPGHGSTFRVYLPLAREIPEPHVPAPPEQPAGQETVLLVEDSRQLRELARKILERHGYRVLPARDAEEAQRLEAQHAERIDLLLTDVVLPGLSGPALANRVRRRRPTMRVLYTTGYIDDDVAHHGVLQEGASLLNKPFTPDALLRKVRAVLDAVV